MPPPKVRKPDPIPEPAPPAVQTGAAVPREREPEVKPLPSGLAQLRSRPALPDVSADKGWHIRHLIYEGRELVLEEGWEPFAFGNGWLMTRKKV